MIKKQNKNILGKANNQAQTATELAVFGAILLFIVGVIIKTSLATSYYQNQAYKAMRMALTMSFKNSEGMSGSSLKGQGNMSHNNASVYIVEDRLSVRSAKYAAMDRNPQIIQGGGSFSKNLLMSISLDYPEQWEYQLPIFDLFVNGKHFPFAMARIKRVCLLQSETDCINATATFSGVNKYDFAPRRELGKINWTVGGAYNDDPANPGGDKIDCDSLYGIAVNTTMDENFCYNGGCPGECIAQGTNPFWNPTPCNISEDDRFDLDRDGSFDVIPADRSEFAWQWLMYRAFDNTTASRTHSTPGVPGLRKGLSIDVDGDLKPENIMHIIEEPDEIKDTTTFSFTANDVAGRIIAVDVMDSQDGDMDGSIDGSDGKPRPGFDRDIQMITQTKKGTAYLVEQGKLFSASTHQFVRSAQRKEKVDWIQRRFQLTNNTGRFCTIDDSGNVTGMPDHVGGNSYTQNPINPVEVCCGPSGCKPSGNDCFDGDNMFKTCMDVGDKTAIPPIYPAIFIRSRIKDQKGRKWITDITNDNYVNFSN